MLDIRCPFWKRTEKLRSAEACHHIETKRVHVFCGVAIKRPARRPGPDSAETNQRSHAPCFWSYKHTFVQPRSLCGICRRTASRWWVEWCCVFLFSSELAGMLWTRLIGRRSKAHRARARRLGSATSGRRALATGPAGDPIDHDALWLALFNKVWQRGAHVLHRSLVDCDGYIEGKRSSMRIPRTAVRDRSVCTSLSFFFFS